LSHEKPHRWTELITNKTTSSVWFHTSAVNHQTANCGVLSDLGSHCIFIFVVNLPTFSSVYPSFYPDVTR